MLADLWPLYRLVIRTPRLELRLPTDEELAAFAGQEVHRPDERPFLEPWTDGTAEDRGRRVLRGHWTRLGSWTPEAWHLGLGIFRDGRGIGMIIMSARNFGIVREISTGSWLGLEYQGQGYGTEARRGVLALAFEHLGARSARSEVFLDNHASQAVSRKLGYRPDGISVDARGDEALVSHRLRLARDDWQPGEAVVDGFEACRPFFVG